MTPRIQVNEQELDDIVHNTRDYLGIDYSGRRRHDLRRRLLWLMEERQVQAPERFLQQFIRRPWPTETINAITPAVTVGETYFLRDPQASQWLRSTFLPAWLQSHRDRNSIDIWSAGCCSGEEAWSLYFLTQEVLAEHQDNKTVRLTATDINAEFLQKAKKGWYPPNSFRIRDDAFRGQYFQASGRGYQIQPKWLEAIEFKQWNLHDTGLPLELGSQDLICCRNVLIYFAADEAEAVIRRFLSALRPGGVLLIGAVEASVATQAGLYGSWAGDNYVLKPAALDSHERPIALAKTVSKLTATDGVPLNTPVHRLQTQPNTIRRRTQQTTSKSLITVSTKSKQSAARNHNQVSSWRDDTLQDLQAGQLQKRQQWLHDALAQPRISVADRAELCLWLAKVSFQLEGLASASNWLDKALQIQPRGALAYVLRAQFFAQTGDMKNAYMAVQQALYIDANDIEANLCAAQLALRNCDHNMSQRYLLRTIERLQGCPSKQRFYFSDGLQAQQLLELCAQLEKLSIVSEGRK